MKLVKLLEGGRKGHNGSWWHGFSVLDGDGVVLMVVGGGNGIGWWVLVGEAGDEVMCYWVLEEKREKKRWKKERRRDGKERKKKIFKLQKNLKYLLNRILVI